MSQEPLPEEDEALLLQTSAEIDHTLRFRDEVLTGREADSRRIFAPPTLDGATFLLSRYGFRGTPILRVMDTVCVESSDQSDLATFSRSLRSLPVISSLLAGTSAAFLCVPGIFNKFTYENQLTVWRTREMAKRQAMDHVMWTTTKIALGVGLKSYFITAGFLYLPFVVSAYRGKTSYWEHSACFGATLSLFCLPRGPLPMLTGGAIGFTLGALYGGLYYLGARRFKFTFEDLYAVRD